MSRFKDQYEGAVGFDEVWPDGVDSVGRFSPPQWWNLEPVDRVINRVDGDRAYPLGYVYDTAIVVEVVVKVRTGVTFPSTDFKIKGKGMGNNITFPPTDATRVGSEITTTITSINKLIPEIKAYLPYKIKWSFSCDDGENWSDAGTTENPLYTHRPPSVSGAAANLYTVVHLSCTGAEGFGADHDDAIIEGIWSKFSGRNTCRVTDGAQMGYYFNWDASATSAGTMGYDDGDGRCDAWADLFYKCLAYQNITGISIRSLAPDDGCSTGLIIKHWTFLNPTQSTAYPDYPYGAVFDSPGWSGSNGDWDYNWDYRDLTYGNGLPAQKTSYPFSLFNYHKVVERNGDIYDPSYGEQYLDVATLEDEAVEGYYFEGTVTYVEGGNQVVRPGFLFQENPANNQLD